MEDCKIWNNEKYINKYRDVYIEICSDNIMVSVENTM